ncbi:AAA family ATPase [Nocardia wallacei]|uniref:AAA family ATPase n=1 Tax=Nocardia wallacei TaxID=480035 RepID=UPI0024538B11|nr:AAA family ATPase [Nocardia wallacei]
MNPPLESGQLVSPDPHIVTPDTVHDLRGRAVDELRYPATAAVIFTGVPGAGKSTALRRLFGDVGTALEAVEHGGATLVDSQQSRNWWHRRLGLLPYALWLPIVHLTHYRRIRRALHGAPTPVVVHDCGTRRWVRRLIASWAAQGGRDVHIIMIDVPAEAAQAGQRARGRRVSRISFALHYSRWRRIVGDVTTGAPPRPVPASVVVLDRTTVSGLRAISFSS